MKRFSLLLLLTVLAPVLAGAQTTVTGRIVGADGRVPVLAHAHLKRSPGEKETIVSVACDRDGAFRLPVAEPGIYTIEITGVDHQVHQLSLLAISRDAIDVDVHLAANNLPERPEEVMVIGDFNDWSFKEPRTMAPRGDGTFAITVDADADSVAYQVMFPIGGDERAMVRSVNGTDTLAYVYDGGGDYRSIVRARGGRATITFDPRLAVRSATSARITYRDSTSAQARYHQIVRRREARLERFYTAMKQSMAAGAADVALPLDAAPQLAEAVRRIDEERDPVLRSVLIVDYFTMKSQHYDAAIARRALAEIAPVSPVWAIDPQAVDAAVRAAGDEAYFERVLREHPNPSLRAQLIYGRLITAHYQEDSVAARRWFERLVREFPDDELTAAARRGLNPDRLVRTGATAPEFAIESLDGESTIGSATLAGRYALIDFWATWCVACVMERKTLHDAYEKYRGERFEILSLSFDRTPEIASTFREQSWPMPWLHAFVKEGFESDLARSFEVQAIPKPLLIDPHGTIVATGAELRGARLDETLTRLLGDPAVGSR